MQQLKAKSIHNKMKDFNQKSTEGKGEYNKIPVRNSTSVDEYSEQYNANHDFAIFQVANAKVGGLMDLKEKQNIADSVDQNSLESD